MSEQSKPRPLWIKATGHQCGDQLCGDNYPESEHDISEDDRWIYTFVQTVDPGTNSVAMKNKWLKVIEASPKTLAAEEMFEALEFYAVKDSKRIEFQRKEKEIDEWNEKNQDGAFWSGSPRSLPWEDKEEYMKWLDNGEKARALLAKIKARGG